MTKVVNTITNFIKQKGNKELFGIQGTPNLPVFVSAYEKGIDIVNNTSENFSIYSSIGKYSKNNQIQFICITMGPGILGGLKALGYCYTNSIPVFLITPYNKINSDNFGEHHSVGGDVDELDTHKILDSFTCYNSILKDKDSLIGLLNKAFDYCSYYKKPVNISIPYNFLVEDIELKIIKKDYNEFCSEKTMLLLGDSVTKDEILEVVNKNLLYFIVGKDIKSYLITNNYLGTLTYDNNSFFEYLINKKIIENICVYKVKGSYYNLGFLLNYKNNITINHIGKNIVDKCYYFLGKRIKYKFLVSNGIDLEKNSITPKISEVIKIIRDKYFNKHKDNKYYRIIKSINQNVENSNIHIAVGGFESWGRRFLNNSSNNYYFSSQYFDMGQVMKSIGFALGNIKKNNICITGDGNLLMNLGELNTISNLNLDFTIILINNFGYKSLYDSYKIYNNGENYKSRAPFNQYSNIVDYKSISESFGFKYFCIEDDFNLLNDLLSDLKGRNIIEIKFSI